MFFSISCKWKTASRNPGACAFEGSSKHLWIDLPIPPISNQGNLVGSSAKKKHITLKITHPQRCQQTWRPPTCNQNAKDKTTQVAARVMLKYAIVRDGLEAFDRPTIAGQREFTGSGFHLPLGMFKAPRHRTFGIQRIPRIVWISWNLTVFLGLHIGHNIGFYLFGSGHFSPSCASRWV